jgi:hypothetical protein
MVTRRVPIILSYVHRKYVAQRVIFVTIFWLAAVACLPSKATCRPPNPASLSLYENSRHSEVQREAPSGAGAAQAERQELRHATAPLFNLEINDFRGLWRPSWQTVVPLDELKLLYNKNKMAIRRAVSLSNEREVGLVMQSTHASSRWFLRLFPGAVSPTNR